MRENDAIFDPQSTETKSNFRTVRFETGASFCCNVKRSRQRASPAKQRALFSHARTAGKFCGFWPLRAVSNKNESQSGRSQMPGKDDFSCFFCANFCCQDCHIVALHAHKSSKLLPNHTNEARRALARAQILPIWTPKMPKNRFETQFWAPDRRHFFLPGEERAAARIPAASRRLTVWPICPQKDLKPSNLCRGGPSYLSPQKPFLSGISRSAHICK